MLFLVLGHLEQPGQEGRSHSFVEFDPGWREGIRGLCFSKVVCRADLAEVGEPLVAQAIIGMSVRLIDHVNDWILLQARTEF